MIVHDQSPSRNRIHFGAPIESNITLASIAGTCSGVITDNSNNGTLLNTNNPIPGFIIGTINGDNLACAVDLNAGNSAKNVLNCVVKDNDSFQNVFLVQR